MGSFSTWVELGLAAYQLPGMIPFPTAGKDPALL